MRFGIAIRPLTISAMSQTVPVLSTADRITVSPCSQANIFHAEAPNRYWAHRAPYSPQPRTVAKAKQQVSRAIRTDTQSPYTVENARVVNARPSSIP